MTRRADHRLNGGGKSRTSSSAEKFLLAPPFTAPSLETHPESPPVTALSSFGGPNDRR